MAEKNPEKDYEFVICPSCGWKNLQTDTYCRKCEKTLPGKIGIIQEEVFKMPKDVTISDVYLELRRVSEEVRNDLTRNMAILVIALGVSILAFAYVEGIYHDLGPLADGGGVMVAFGMLGGVLILIGFLIVGVWIASSSRTWGRFRAKRK